MCSVEALEDLDSPGARLRHARAAAGYPDAASFARVMKMKEVSYRAYELDQNGYAKHATDFAAKLGVSTDWLLRGGAKPDIVRSAVASADPLSSIPMVGIRHADAAFGLGAVFTDEQPQIEVLQFPKPWVESITYTSPELLSWVRARGSSMAPTINDGDMILLDHSERKVQDQDELWAYTVEETRGIKRLRVKGDRYQILSDNPAVPPDEEPIDFVNIVGRVIFIGRRT